MTITFKASAPATVANQPAFDQGGFAVKVEDVLLGLVPQWMSFRDIVTVEVDTGAQGGRVKVENIVEEAGVSKLPTDSTNTAVKPILSIIDELRNQGIDFPYDVSIKVKKGLSVKGSGLGSSGATPAAALLAFEAILKRLDISYSLSDLQKAEILKLSDFGVPDNAIPAHFGSLVTMSQPGLEFVIERHEIDGSFGSFLLIIPQDFGIKTEDARKALEGLSAPQDNDQLVESMKLAIKDNDLDNYVKNMKVIHQWWSTPRSRLYPAQFFLKVRKVLDDAGSLGTTISGAGPTMLCWLSGKEDLERLTKNLDELFDQLKQSVLVVKGKIDDEGARLEE